MTTATELDVKRADSYWAEYFGCKIGDLYEAKTLVVPHAALRGYDGVLAFRHDAACIISVPPEVPEIGRRKLREASPDQAFDPRVLGKSLVVWEEQISPLGWVGVCEPQDFRPARAVSRLLTFDDARAMQHLAQALGESARWASDLPYDRDPMFGIFQGKDLVAASSFLNMGGVFAYIGVVTHPEHRGRGYARGVAGEAMKYAFDRDLIPLWRTWVSNKAARSVARALGFRRFAFTREIQLSSSEF